MKAIQFISYGGPEVLSSVETESPVPGPGEVLIQVASAGINQLDAKIRSGSMAATKPLSFPSGTGFDAAGTVLAVGDGVVDVAPGDTVFGIGKNTVAEQALLNQWAQVPQGIDPTDAGGWGVAVETAGRLLTELNLTEGTILISGASGGVGSALIQLALGRGLKVIGTASERNHDYLSSLGAIPMAYGPGLATRVAKVAPEGIDGALDISGAGVISDLVTIVGNAARVISISDFTAPRHGARISSSATRTTNPRDAFAEATALLHFILNIEHKYPIEDISAAHKHIELGHTIGKIIVIP